MEPCDFWSPGVPLLPCAAIGLSWEVGREGDKSEVGESPLCSFLACRLSANASIRLPIRLLALVVRMFLSAGVSATCPVDLELDFAFDLGETLIELDLVDVLGGISSLWSRCLRDLESEREPEEPLVPPCRELRSKMSIPCIPGGESDDPEAGRPRLFPPDDDLPCARSADF